MNSLGAPNVFMRSLATRRQHLATSAVLADVIALYRAAGFDLIVVETAGIGQSDTEIVDLADLSLYVMTAEYGAASQLEKIDMLDFADMIVLNKFEKRGAEDALRDVRKQWRRKPSRSHEAAGLRGAGVSDHREPLQRPGRKSPVRRAVRGARSGSRGRGSWSQAAAPMQVDPVKALSARPAHTVRPHTLSRGNIGARTRSAQGAATKADAARRAHGLYLSLQTLADPDLPEALVAAPSTPSGKPALDELRAAYNRALQDVGPEAVAALRAWPAREHSVSDAEYSYTVRGREVRGSNYTESLSHSAIPKLAAPKLAGWGEILEFLQNENLPEVFLTPRASIPIVARKRIRPACSRARARRNAPTAGFTIWPPDTRPRDYPRLSIRPRCTVRTRTCGQTSLAAPAIPECRLRRSMT
jgi:methylmalonyl-CoA mutase